jgi:hypothetical protein
MIIYKIIYDIIGLKILLFPVAGLIWRIINTKTGSRLLCKFGSKTGFNFNSDFVVKLGSEPWYISILVGILLFWALVIISSLLFDTASSGYFGFASLWLAAYTPVIVLLTFPVWGVIWIVTYFIERCYGKYANFR